MHFCSLVAKSWECKSDNNKSIGQRLAKILVYCEKPWRTSIGLKQLVKVSHRGLVGGRLELREALYVDRLVVPCTVKQSACPHFLSLSKSFDQYWSFSIIIEIFFINTDLRWHHLWTTRSLGLIQSHGRCEEPHTELQMIIIFILLWNFHHDLLWQFFFFVIILHMYFLERKEYVLSGECIRSPPPCLDLLIARIGITFGRVLPLWSFSAWWWSWWSNDNHIIQSFCFTPLIILRMTMIMRTMFLRW